MAAMIGNDMTDVRDLEPLSKRLNAATDELNAALESIQDKINDLALGVEIWLDGTNDVEGRKLLADAAPPNVHVEQTMLGAAARVVELAGSAA